MISNDMKEISKSIFNKYHSRIIGSLAHTPPRGMGAGVGGGGQFFSLRFGEPTLSRGEDKEECDVGARRSGAAGRRKEGAHAAELPRRIRVWHGILRLLPGLCAYFASIIRHLPPSGSSLHAGRSS
jgi:hypothetical protein